MNTYEIGMINGAIAAHREGKNGYSARPKQRFARRAYNRGSGRKWDSVVRVVCLGCGKTLGRYENIHGLAWCFNCRKVLFPETIGPQYVPGSRTLSPLVP